MLAVPTHLVASGLESAPIAARAEFLERDELITPVVARCRIGHS
jgi:hypothetical protein